MAKKAKTKKKPSIFTPRDTVVPALKKPFRVSEEFQVGKNGITHIDPEFKRRFGTMIVKPRQGHGVSSRVLAKKATGREIADELDLRGKNRHVADLAALQYLLVRQANGEEGPLSLSGWSIFQMLDCNGELVDVSVLWYGGGWFVYASAVENPRRWFDGDEVFSRKFR